MPRKPGPLHAAADRIEPSFQVAIFQALSELRKGVSIERLAYALSARDVKAAMNALPERVATEVLERAKKIMVEAFMRGGRVGAKELGKKL
jgi:hypothetical protein